MDDATPGHTRTGDFSDGFTFHGRWQEFLPIAATNLLLTIVTLGIYRFWAKTRERRYLWSRTQFIDERLEWAGTGKEMFIGFLIVMAIFVPLLVVVQFGVQALAFRGHALAAGVLGLGTYLAIFYLVGLALFRALRYRLSRTYWHGIRGGSDDGGWNYGVSALWKYVVGFLTFGLLIPWTMVTLWRERWSKMSFGPFAFETGDSPPTRGLIGRYLLIYATPVVWGLIVAVLGMGTIFTAMTEANPRATSGMAGMFILSVFSFYILFSLLSLAYYAAFMRKVIGELGIGDLRFSFEARTMDWVMLILGNFALVIFTLGFGIMYLGYRHWSFYVRHLKVQGEVDLATLTQSTTRLRSDAEGLADAFDIGAI
ncbi:YjgN family protein [Sphingosinicella microcystinivorans]|uniref:YjgN family protein n=1 Tax=Sphingosinicella microcystinivorans TaxID=335406 RepID=UPI0022F406FD|nr:YjgN family protein [Sphingosinicella microcystinivorans]WBX84793.1 YjgN family protein [Sphingosinicella microcystinivorans]